MDKLNLDQLVSKQFNTHLEELKTMLLEMGGIVEQQIINAVNAIENADEDLAEQVLVVEVLKEINYELHHPMRLYREYFYILIKLIFFEYKESQHFQKLE